MPIKSDAQRRAVARYNAENYTQIQIRVPKGYKAVIQERAEVNGESVNAYINRLINEDIENRRNTTKPKGLTD